MCAPSKAGGAGGPAIAVTVSVLILLFVPPTFVDGEPPIVTSTSRSPETAVAVLVGVNGGTTESPSARAAYTELVYAGSPWRICTL